MAMTSAPVLSDFQWQLLEIRTEIEHKKTCGELSHTQELEIVMDALHLIHLIHADDDDLMHATSLFWDAAGLPLPERISKLWEAIDVFIQ